MQDSEWLDDMSSTALADPKELARRMESRVLRTLRDSTQAAVAAAMGTSPTTVSRLLSGSLQQFCEVLAHSGLRIVPATSPCYSKEYAKALHVMAEMHLRQTEPHELDWGDE